MFFTDLHNHLWIITDAVLIGTKHSVQTVHNPIFLAYNEFIEANIQVNTAKDVYIYIYTAGCRIVSKGIGYYCVP